MILELCHMCIQSCEGFILDVVDSDVLERRSPDLWDIAQSCMTPFVVLFMASASCHLRHLTPNLDVLAGAFALKVRK